MITKTELIQKLKTECRELEQRKERLFKKRDCINAAVAGIKQAERTRAIALINKLDSLE